MSRDCCVALPCNAMSLSAFVIVIFPDHSHLLFLTVFTFVTTGPRSAVGNVSCYRYMSDCRSRGRKFDPGLVPFFRGD